MRYFDFTLQVSLTGSAMAIRKPKPGMNLKRVFVFEGGLEKACRQSLS